VTRALGGDHDHVTAGLGPDVVEADVEAVAEEQRRTLAQVGLDLVRVDGPLHLVRREDDDEVGLLDRVGDREDTQALGLGLGLGLGALGQADAHVDAAVTQVERVGVALAAVADDGDLAPLDDRQVGVVVVEHLGHGSASPFGWVGIRWFEGMPRGRDAAQASARPAAGSPAGVS
jgi:hypothetical protein